LARPQVLGKGFEEQCSEGIALEAPIFAPAAAPAKSTTYAQLAIGYLKTNCSPMPNLTIPNTPEFSHQFVAFAGLQSRGGAYSSQDSQSPSDGTVNVEILNESASGSKASPEQLVALQYLTDHPAEIRTALFKALEEEYPKLKEMYDLDTDDLEFSEWFPLINQPEDFAQVFGVGNLFVFEEHRDGIAYLGLECGCTWDDEHGLGFVMHQNRVIEIGQADTAFSSWPARDDMKQRKGTADSLNSIGEMEEDIGELTDFLRDTAELQSAAREKLEEVKRGRKWWQFWR
jgi:hypothetical protein